MSTSPQTMSDSAPPPAEGAGLQGTGASPLPVATPARQDAAPILGATAFFTFLKSQWQWLFVLVPYALAWGLPFLWSWYQWTVPAHIQYCQIFVLPLTGALLYFRRDLTASVWRRVKARPERGFWQRGNSVLLVIGSLMLAFSHLVQIKGVAVIGLLLLGWGVIYQIYGAKILRALRLPVLFSLIVIPPPDTVVDKFMQLMDILTLRSAALIFRLIGRQAVVAYEQINFSANGYVLDYQGHAAAAGILSTSLLFSLFYAMVRRYHISRFLPLLVLTTINFLVVNLVRIIVAGLIAGNSADMGKLIGQNSYVLLAMLPFIVLPALFIETSLSNVAHRVMANTRRRSRSAPARAPGGDALNRAGDAVAAPIEFGIRRANTLWRRSEKGIESALRKVPKTRNNPFILIINLLKRSEQGIESVFRLLFPRKKRRRHKR